MYITNEQFDLFSRIYNAMLEINTRGEDTLLMADCLRALKQTLTEIDQNSKINEEKKEG